jgi:hypothetical protein
MIWRKNTEKLIPHKIFSGILREWWSAPAFSRQGEGMLNEIAECWAPLVWTSGAAADSGSK